LPMAGHEHDSQIIQTPETNRLLENLQQDTNDILRGKKELGFQVKKRLAARTQEFAALGYFYIIPTTDFLWGDERPGEDDEDSGKLGLVVHRETNPGDENTTGGVIMTPDGVLLKSYANDGRSGGTFSFGFESAEEVPLEEYPTYFDKAVQAMKYITDEETGVHAAEFRKEQAEREAKRIQQIKDDNQRYGIEGAMFTGDSEVVAKVNEFMQRIADMRKMVAQDDKKITAEQLENLLGHIFAAEEYLDEECDGNSWGARELTFMAGSLISPKDAWIGKNLHDLVNDMWSAPSGSSYLVRRANRVPPRENPENKRIYDTMTGHLLSRHREGGEDLFSVPEFKQPPAEIVTEHYGTVLSEEIINWLLAPVEEPTSL
jgi:hypothetical protein